MRPLFIKFCLTTSRSRKELSERLQCLPLEQSFIHIAASRKSQGFSGSSPSNSQMTTASIAFEPEDVWRTSSLGAAGGSI